MYGLGYMFAIEKPDPKQGRIKAAQIQYTIIRGESIKETTEIPMVDCNVLLQDGFINNRNFNPYDTTYRKPAEFICPDTRSLVLQGNWSSISFSYVEIAYVGCDQDLLTEGECTNANGSVFAFHDMQSFVDFTESEKDKVLI